MATPPSTGDGNLSCLDSRRKILGEAVAAAGRTNTFLGDRYRRPARRSGAAARASD